jgi:hypothetical protein
LQLQGFGTVVKSPKRAIISLRAIISFKSCAPLCLAQGAQQGSSTSITTRPEDLQEEMKGLHVAKVSLAVLVAFQLSMGGANAGSSSSAASKYAGQHREVVAQQASKTSVPLTEFSSSSRKTSPKQ